MLIDETHQLQIDPPATESSTFPFLISAHQSRPTGASTEEVTQKKTAKAIPARTHVPFGAGKVAVFLRAFTFSPTVMAFRPAMTWNRPGNVLK